MNNKFVIIAATDYRSNQGRLIKNNIALRSQKDPVSAAYRLIDVNGIARTVQIEENVIRSHASTQDDAAAV